MSLLLTWMCRHLVSHLEDTITDVDLAFSEQKKDFVWQSEDAWRRDRVDFFTETLTDVLRKLKVRMFTQIWNLREFTNAGFYNSAANRIATGQTVGNDSGVNSFFDMRERKREENGIKHSKTPGVY